MMLLKYLMRENKGLVIWSVVIGVVSGFATARIMSLIALFLRGELSDWHLYAGMVVLALVTAVISNLISVRLSIFIIYSMRINLCAQILKLPLREIESAGSARLLASFTEDIPVISGAMLMVPTMIVNLAIVLGCLGYLGLVSLPASAFLVVFIAYEVTSYIITEKRAIKLMIRMRKAVDVMMKYFTAAHHGIKELKLHYNRRETFFNKLYRVAVGEVRIATRQFGVFYAALGSYANVLYFIFLGLLVFVAPLFLKTDSKTLITFTLVSLFLNGPIAILVTIIPEVRRAGVSFQAIQDLGLSSFVTEVQDPFADREIVSQRIHQAPKLEKLELRGVRHTFYREREEGHFTLGPIDLEVASGEIVFIIGGNGSGKTTLAKLITGLYSPESGEILVNETVVTEDNRELYRNYFTAIFADFFVFEQLLGMEQAQLDERARALLQQLHLDHKVTIEDGKLSTRDLSKGQRKRLALLTAYLEDRQIYLFDEWAADQDPEFKDVFYRELLPTLKRRGKTVFVISHDDRYFDVADSTIKLADGHVEQLKRAS